MEGEQRAMCQCVSKEELAMDGLRGWMRGMGGVAVIGLALGCAPQEATNGCSRDPRCGDGGSDEPAAHCRGRAPVFNLAVTEDSSLSGELSVMCEQGGSVVENEYPCMVPETGNVEFQNRYFVELDPEEWLRLTLRQTDGFVGRTILVEVQPDQAVGRVCLRHVTDVLAEACRADEFPTEDCAVSGALSITRLPGSGLPGAEDMYVAGEVRFADGLEITFSVPLADAE